MPKLSPTNQNSFFSSHVSEDTQTMVAVLTDDLEVAELIHLRSGETKEGILEQLLLRADNLAGRNLVICETTLTFDLTREQGKQLSSLARILNEVGLELIDYCLISNTEFKSFRRLSLL